MTRLLTASFVLVFDKPCDLSHSKGGKFRHPVIITHSYTLCAHLQVKSSCKMASCDSDSFLAGPGRSRCPCCSEPGTGNGSWYYCRSSINLRGIKMVNLVIQPLEFKYLVLSSHVDELPICQINGAELTRNSRPSGTHPVSYTIMVHYPLVESSIAGRWGSPEAGTRIRIRLGSRPIRIRTIVLRERQLSEGLELLLRLFMCQRLSTG